MALEGPLLGAKRKSLDSDLTSACSHKRKFVMPTEVEHWSLPTLRQMLVKIGAKVVRHGRYVTFQMAEVAVPRDLFREILKLIDGLRRSSLAAG